MRDVYERHADNGWSVLLLRYKSLHEADEHDHGDELDEGRGDHNQRGEVERGGQGEDKRGHDERVPGSAAEHDRAPAGHVEAGHMAGKHPHRQVVTGTPEQLTALNIG